MLELIPRAFDFVWFSKLVTNCCFINCKLFIILERAEINTHPWNCYQLLELLNAFKGFTGPYVEFSGTGSSKI